MLRITLREERHCLDHSLADAEICVANIAAPLLVIENTADDAVPASHPKCVFDAATTKDKTFLKIERATHYYREQPEQLEQAIIEINNWLQQRSLIDRN